MSVNKNHAAPAALIQLCEAGYFGINEAGWCYARKPPTQKDLAWYVGAIKKLGAWSVGTKCFEEWSNALVEISSGSLADEVLFRIDDKDLIVELRGIFFSNLKKGE